MRWVDLWQDEVLEGDGHNSFSLQPPVRCHTDDVLRREGLVYGDGEGEVLGFIPYHLNNMAQEPGDCIARRDGRTTLISSQTHCIMICYPRPCLALITVVTGVTYTVNLGRRGGSRNMILKGLRVSQN